MQMIAVSTSVGDPAPCGRIHLSTAQEKDRFHSTSTLPADDRCREKRLSHPNDMQKPVTPRISFVPSQTRDDCAVV